ncbi:hypothetical protein DFH27DRAFT_558211, partial [Peziza echinospora]
MARLWPFPIRSAVPRLPPGTRLLPPPPPPAPPHRCRQRPQPPRQFPRWPQTPQPCPQPTEKTPRTSGSPNCKSPRDPTHLPLFRCACINAMLCTLADPIGRWTSRYMSPGQGCAEAGWLPQSRPKYLLSHGPSAQRALRHGLQYEYSSTAAYPDSTRHHTRPEDSLRGLWLIPVCWELGMRHM